MASTYLSRSISSTSNRQTLTISAWVKRSALSSGSQFRILTARSGSDQNWFSFDNDTLILGHYNGSSYQYRNITNRLFRDSSAWYHIVIAIDTTQATASDRVKIYVNGVEETSFSTEVQPSLNQNTVWNTSGYTNYIGQDGTSTSYYDGSMAHFHLIDGTAYDADTFGETDATTGIWKPKTAPSVTYGTNGFFLKFENSGAFGTDSSGNGNNFTVNGTMTQTIDTPSNVFTTWNSLANQGSVNLDNGNTRAVFTGAGWNFVYSTLGASSGKYYYEVKVANTGSDSNIGIMEMDTATNEQGTADNVGKNTESVAYQSNGSIRKNNSEVQTGLTSLSNGDILGIAMDLDNNTVQFYLNGSSVGSAVSIASDKVYAFATSGYGSSEHQTNFGNGYFGTTQVSSAQNPDDGIGIFEFSPPTGYKSLCTKSINSQEYD